MVAGGIYNVYISNQVIAPAKLARVAALTQAVASHSGGQIAIAVDSLEGVNRLAKAMTEARTGARSSAATVIDVFVEIDVGQGRCGVQPGEAAVRLALEIRKHPALRFAGLQAYQGKAQHLRSAIERRMAAASATKAVEADLPAAQGARHRARAGDRRGHRQLRAGGRQRRLRRAAGRLLHVHGRRLCPERARPGAAAVRARAVCQDTGHQHPAPAMRCATPATRATPSTPACRRCMPLTTRASWTTSTAATSTASCGPSTGSTRLPALGQHAVADSRPLRPDGEPARCDDRRQRRPAKRHGGPHHPGRCARRDDLKFRAIQAFCAGRTGANSYEKSSATDPCCPSLPRHGLLLFFQ